jgi:hypothetical protein
MQQLMEKSQETVNGLSGETDDVTDARVQLLSVLSLANVTVGRVAKAREFAAQASALAEGLVAKNRANPLWMGHWAIAEEYLAEALFWQGDLDGALQHARAGEPVLAGLARIMHEGVDLCDGCGAKPAIHVANRCQTNLPRGSPERHSRYDRHYTASLRPSICPAQEGHS